MQQQLARGPRGLGLQRAPSQQCILTASRRLCHSRSHPARHLVPGTAGLGQRRRLQQHQLGVQQPFAAAFGHQGDAAASGDADELAAAAAAARPAGGADGGSSPQQPEASTSGRGGAGGTNSSSTAHAFDGLSREMLAAMALSPLAALSLPLATNPEWRAGAGAAADRLRAAVNSDAFGRWLERADDGATYMDWAWRAFGVDLSQVWDPDLWVKLKTAVRFDEPRLFWNALWDRIDFRSKVPDAGFAGDMRISYAKFLQLLEAHRVKRVIVYGDMRTAVVEVPHPWTASLAGDARAYPFYVEGAPAEEGHMKHLGLLVPAPDAPDDPSRWLAPEAPEWAMEKYRFYVDLPGDFWQNGQLMTYLRARSAGAGATWDPQARAYVLPWTAFTRLGEVRTELQIMDPAESWGFLAWLLDERKLKFYEQAAAFALFVRGCSIAINVISSTKFVKFIAKKRAKKNKKADMWARLTRAPAREFMTKDAKTGQLRDTGVRFADIAGMPGLVFEMREVVKMLLRDPAYVRVGARAPRGVIFQGPPGTGKTYLARAIAGEAGVTFLSAVGSEFVEMYAGVAAARVNSLYHSARKKAPCIVFIDEIDAIGRARSALGGDPGSIERESALLAMLVAMDGIHGNLEQVLTIGATNLAQDLDQALLRPGRFEVVYEIPSPGPTARLEILKYHSRNKPLDGDGDAMLRRVAEMTQGWSAAALANLMNEAAILTVRRSVDKISLPMVADLVESQEWGPSAPKIPPSAAKDRLARVTAAKAVALALTPGVERIKFVTMWSRRRGQGPYVEFESSEESLDAAWHPEEVELMSFKTNFKVNAARVGGVALGEWLHVALMILPLYAPRAAELELYGEDGASLATAAPIADAFELAYYCVRNSGLHPRFRAMPPLHTYVYLGDDAAWRNQRDPLARGLDEELGYHRLTLALLKAAWARARRLVQERRTAIARVAEEMVAAEDERLPGTRLVEILESTPLDEATIEVGSDFMPIVREVLGRRMPEVMARAAALEQQRQQAQQQQQQQQAGGGEGSGEQQQQQQAGGSGSADAIQLDDETLVLVARAVMGRLDVADLVGRNTAEELAERAVDTLLHPETVERLRAIRKYVDAPAATGGGAAPFPPAPPAGAVPGPLYGNLGGNLDAWRQRNVDVFTGGAAELLLTERQLRYYAKDMDVPAFEDTADGLAAAAAGSAGTAAAAGGSAAEGSSQP